MPIRRSLLNTFCLMMFGTASVMGQQSVPFEEWDNHQAKSRPSRAVQRSPKSSVTYFSPKADEKSDASSSEAENVGQIPMRERAANPRASSLTTNASGKSSRSSAKPVAVQKSSAETGAPGSGAPGITNSAEGIQSSSTQSSAATPTSEFGWDVTSRAKKSPPSTTTGRAATAGKQQAVRNSTVQQAGFDPSAKKETGTGIVQVSQPGSEPKPDDEEGNPFADFLKEAEESAEPTAAESDSAKSIDELAEGEETAESLLPRRPASRTPANQAAAAGAPNKTVAATQPTVNESTEPSGPQSPGVTVQWVRHGEFNVGQECDVDLVIQNTSKSVVRSVMTEAIVPAEVELVETKPSPMQGTDTPTWTFGELKPGETRTVTMKMIPRQRGDVRLDAFVRLTGSSSSAFSVQEPIIGVAVSGPERAEVGEQVAYVVRVSNPGTGVASNVVIQAAIPEGLEHRSGSLLSIEIGTLNPGESRQARLNVTAVKGGAQELAVRAIADGGLNEETVTKVSVAEPQLNISITGPEVQMAGRTGDYKLTVSNAGNVQSANVRATYKIPTGFEYVSSDRGGKYRKTDHSIEWFVGGLQPSDTSDFQLTLRAVETGELLHQAGVMSEHGHVAMCDLATVVEGTAVLDLTIVASDKDLKKGEEVTWSVTIRNSGSRAADNVGMSCELPAGISLISADGPAEHIAENGVMVFRSLPSIEAGQDAVFTIKARCMREGNHRLRLRVASESITDPLIGEEAATVVDR